MAPPGSGREDHARDLVVERRAARERAREVHHALPRLPRRGHVEAAASGGGRQEPARHAEPVRARVPLRPLPARAHGLQRRTPIEAESGCMTCTPSHALEDPTPQKERSDSLAHPIRGGCGCPSIRAPRPRPARVACPARVLAAPGHVHRACRERLDERDLEPRIARLLPDHLPDLAVCRRNRGSGVCVVRGAAVARLPDLAPRRSKLERMDHSRGLRAAITWLGCARRIYSRDAARPVSTQAWPEAEPIRPAAGRTVLGEGERRGTGRVLEVDGLSRQERVRPHSGWPTRRASAVHAQACVRALARPDTRRACDRSSLSQPLVCEPRASRDRHGQREHEARSSTFDSLPERP